MNNEKLIRLPKEVERIDLEKTTFMEDSTSNVELPMVDEKLELVNEQYNEIASNKIPQLQGQLETIELKKIDKVQGKWLSTNDYTDSEKSKVSLISNKADVAYVDNKVAGLSSVIPKIVQNISEMTDNTKQYVLSSDGFIYQFNGSSFSKTSILYQSTGITDESVTNDKLNYLVNVSWVFGSIFINNGNEADDNTRARTSYLKLNKGDVVKCPPNKKIMILFYSDIGLYFTTYINYNEKFIAQSDCTVRVVAKYANDAIISNINDFLLDIKIYSLNKNIEVIKNTKFIDFILGGMDINGLDNEDKNRIKTSFINTEDTSIVKLLTTNIAEFFVISYDEKFNFVKYEGGWGSSTTTISPTGTYYRVCMKKKDNTDVTDIKSLVSNLFIRSTKLHSKDIQSSSITFNNLSNELKGSLPVNPLINKKLLGIGDSIMQGTGDASGGFAKLIGEKNAMIVNNVGVGGATITVREGNTNNIVNQVNSVISKSENYDYILMNGLTNDANTISQASYGSVTNGYDDNYNISTFCGAFEYILKSLRNKYLGAKIVYVRPHNMASRDGRQKELGELALSICEKWSIPVVDLYKSGGLNTQISNMIGVYTIATDDRTHPNKLGYETFYVPQIESKMKSV